MALEPLAENYLSRLLRDFERPAFRGVDFAFFCYQHGIALNDLQPFVTKLKSEGLVSEPRFLVYTLTVSGYVRYKGSALRSFLKGMASRAVAAVRK